MCEYVVYVCDNSIVLLVFESDMSFMQVQLFLHLFECVLFIFRVIYIILIYRWLSYFLVLRLSCYWCNIPSTGSCTVGYIEPTMVILHERELTWAGRVSWKHHTCMICALSINTTSKQHPLIWSAIVSALPKGCLFHHLRNNLQNPLYSYY